MIVINNDSEAANIEFDVSQIASSGVFKDQLGVSRPVQINDGKMRVSLPKRSAAIFAP